MKRTKIKSTSTARAVQLREYSKLKVLHLNGQCEACTLLKQRPVRMAADVHHKRGRMGRLLCDVRHWLAVCRPCHNWIHDNPKQAREINLLAGIGQWNTYDEHDPECDRDVAHPKKGC